MSKLSDELNNMKCDTEAIMDRFMNDEKFYIDCLREFLNDQEFEKLEVHNIKEAFECAHTLKGVCANMGLKSMYDIIVQIVDSLRAGSDDGLLKKYNKLMLEKEKYDNIAKVI